MQLRSELELKMDGELSVVPVGRPEVRSWKVWLDFPWLAGPREVWLVVRLRARSPLVAVGPPESAQRKRGQESEGRAR